MFLRLWKFWIFFEYFWPRASKVASTVSLVFEQQKEHRKLSAWVKRTETNQEIQTGMPKLEREQLIQLDSRKIAFRALEQSSSIPNKTVQFIAITQHLL